MQEDLDEFRAALAGYVAAGAIRRDKLDYDIAQDERLFTSICEFAPKIFKADTQQSYETFDTNPVFILDVPRSGTTSAEQVIQVSHTLMVQEN